ncbi:PepSY-like domain-containing protein [Parabacteroides chinchillae]
MKRMVCTIVLAAGLLMSCDDNNDKGLEWVSETTQTAFTTQYPSAKSVGWEKRNTYLVADFKQDNKDTEAWYDNNGVWYMTETDIPFDALPSAVKTSFQQSEYKNWKVDDVDMIERKDMETVYVIEVEEGNTETDLYYSPDGILIKAVADVDTDDDYEDFIPAQPAGNVEEYIKTTYPDARIIEIEKEKDMTEVDILDGKVKRELLFKADGSWVQTKTDVHTSDLPSAVVAAIKASPYATYEIDDAEFIQTPSEEWYLVELEQGKLEVDLRITEDGIIL